MTRLLEPERLDYTGKDLPTIDTDVERYISAFIPTIRGMTVSNEGRLIIRLFEALIDMLNFSVDMQFRESNIIDAAQKRNLLRLLSLVGYKNRGASPSQLDCDFHMLTGVAPPGGEAIPLWTQLQRSASPVISFVTALASSIPEGETEVTGVPVIQGTPVMGEVLSAACSGDPDQSYTLNHPKVVVDQLLVYVGGALWGQVEDLWDSEPGDAHYRVEFDEDGYCTIIFGDGEFGYIPPGGSAITCDYIRTDGAGHDVGVEEIDTVIGALSMIVGVTNPLSSSGASDGDSLELIQKRAPEEVQSQGRAVTVDDVESEAKKVTGVFDARVYSIYGNTVNLYVLPHGGGAAGGALITAVEDYVRERAVLQGDINAESTNPCLVRIKAMVTAWNNRISKSVLNDHARRALLAAFAYDRFKLGDAYTISQVGDVILNYQDRTMFKSVDFPILTRWPRVVQSNPAAPGVSQGILVTSSAGYDVWVLTATGPTSYNATKNGIIQTTPGSVGQVYIPPDGEVRVVLGAATDVLSAGDTWTFYTSKLSGNLFVGEGEHMKLNEADLEVQVFYPGEYNPTA